MLTSRKMSKNPIVAISFGESVHWKNRGAMPSSVAARLGPTIRPISRKLLQAATADAVPHCLPETEWKGGLLYDNMGSAANGRTVAHLMFMLLHRSIDIREANIAEALWRAFDDGVLIANEVKLKTLEAAQHEAVLTLRKGVVA